MTDVAKCPDCLRPKYNPVGPEDQGDRCESSGWRGPMTQQIKCAKLTIDRLRSEIAAAHAKPSPELTAVEAHNAEAVRLLRVLGGVVFTRHMGGESNVVAVAKWLDNDALLLAARAKAGR